MSRSVSIFKCCNLVLLAILLLSRASMATSSVTTYACANANVSCTLQELFNGGFFEVEGLRFDNWQFVSSSYTTPTAPDPSQMKVEVYDTALLDELFSEAEEGGEGPGFRFINDFEGIHGDEYSDFKYAFQVAVLNNNQVLKSNSLLLDGYSGSTLFEGLFEVNELVKDNLGVELASKNIFVERPSDDKKAFDVVEFLPQSIIHVETELLESGSPLNDEFYQFSLNTYFQRFGYAVVPIPPALWLFGAGLLGLLGIARKKKAA